MTIRGKITALGVALVLLTTGAIVGITRFQEKRIGQRVSAIIKGQARQEAGKVARNVHLMCEVMRAEVQETVSHNIRVAEDLLQRQGGIKFAEEQVDWQAVNQFNQQTTHLSLPKMQVGNDWLSQNLKADSPTPLVDEIKSLVGGTATVFQRMNEAGDMLRVATNVLQADGSRAIGTFIPQSQPDGITNEVIAAVLAGETYFGRAFVVNTWYMTAYEPIWDQTGQKVVGMLYVGEMQENIPSLRLGIRTMSVGQTGYVQVLGGSGDHLGQLQISPDPALRGNSLWDLQDSSNQRLVMRDIIAKAKQLHTRDEQAIPVAFDHFTLQQEGDAQPRRRIAAISYYEPWDWVVVAVFNEDDLDTAHASVAKGLIDIVRSVVAVAVAVMLLAVIAGLILACNIIEPLKQTAAMIKGLKKGRFDQRLNLDRHDEIGEIAGAMDSFADDLQQEIQTTFEKLAQGDFTFQAKGMLAAPLAKANLALNDLIQEAQGIADQVAQGAAEMSDEATPAEAQPKAADSAELSGDQTPATTGKIFEIIKVIEEIAFQTNLLTLSAASESTRSSESCASLAEVAEEVRTLAARSARTAKDTAELIEGTSGVGSPSTDQMATALRKIVAGIGQATELASEIAVTSKAPATSQAETLLSQAQRLKGLLANFKVCQQDNLAAWTEFQAGALSSGATKKDKTGKK
ncbi:MAG: Cache 3/Cache 2 fusion domain-containing protein [Desulfuromonadaceae bacterium]|nr:Cache 3/Cache 2 fusion domain-containing protein [Desulfuromonadaceae bacterium]